MINGHASGEALTRPILDALMKDKNLITPPPVTAKKPVEAQKVPEDLLKFAGIYAKSTAPFKIVFNKDKNGFEIYPLEPAKKEKRSGGENAAADKNNNEVKDGKIHAAPVIAYVYNAGFFHNFEKEAKCYFAEIDGRQYLVQHKIKTYGVDTIEYQKLDEIKDPVSFKTDIAGKAWLVRNEKPYVLAGSIGIAKTDFYEELPGYVNFAGVKKIENPEYAGIAVAVFRDQADLRLIDMNGETCIKTNYGLCSPADSARKLITGVNRVVIKSENYNEWLRVEKGAIVNFDKPQKGRIIVVTEENAIYDSVVDKDEIYAPEGSFIFCAGTAGDLFKIIAR
ncbi:MAG TPA: hypothetical protein DC017_11850 [Candidatus Wallbacteria bacterium]|nr:hypothetical protein [Candidatus Wallbacteria bacterium]